MRWRSLLKSPLLTFEAADVYDSLTGSLAAWFASRELPVALHEIAGRPGFAFRNCYDPRDPARSWRTDWRADLDRAAAALGLQGVEIKQGAAAADLLKKHAGRELLLSWRGLGVDEFCIFRGMHGGKLVFHGRHAAGLASAATAPADFLGDSGAAVIRIEARRAVSNDSPRALAARACAELGATVNSTDPHELWRAALASGAAGEGDRQLLQIVAQSRTHGAAFLTEIADAIPEGGDGDREAVALATAANELDSAEQLYSGILRDVWVTSADFARHERHSAAAGMLASARRRELAALRQLQSLL